MLGIGAMHGNLVKPMTPIGHKMMVNQAIAQECPFMDNFNLLMSQIFWLW